MTFLKNLSLRTKLLIASLIPVIALLYYLQLNVRQELKNKKAAQDIIADVSLIHDISRLTHEFQKERALTLTFLSTNGTQGRDQIASQRQATDDAISALKKVLKVQQRSIKTDLFIDSLNSVRSKADALMPVAEVDHFFNDFKTALLDEVSVILRSADNVQIKNRLEEHLFLLYTKDFLAQLRSEL